MITHPTVLILGAGVSMDYGFPSARALKADICEQFSNENGEANKLFCNAEYSYTPLDLIQFCQALRLSAQPSVDAFLERNSAYMTMGKMAIAYCLIPYEQELKLFPPRSDLHIYEYIFSRLGSDLDTFGDNRLSVITLNYDRSFEHFLATALYNSNHTSCTEQRAEDAVTKIPIVHLYGQLAYLPWQSPVSSHSYKANPMRRFRPDRRYADVNQAAAAIKVISDKRDAELETDSDFLKAWKVIREAETICFFGFGYNRANLQRLRINNADPRCKMLGTAFDLPETDKKAVQRACKGIKLEPVQSLGMLLTHGILE
jgi:hypothetical protein